MGVHVRGDRDDSLTILPPYGRRRHARIQRGCTGNRDLGPARRTEQVPFDIGDGIPLIGGQADVDSDLFPAALHPDRFRAKKRGARLTGQRFERETEGPRFRPQLELNFRDARGVIRTHVVNASHFTKAADHGVCDLDEVFRVRMGHDGLDRIA